MFKHTGKLTFMLAPARAGKSTFANKWVKESDSDGLNRVIVCSDDIRLGLHGQRYIREAEPMVWTLTTIMTKAHLLRGCHVLLDETHSSFQSIKNTFKLDINAKPIFINTPLEVCLQRCKDTGQEDLWEPIKRMYQNIVKIAKWSNYPNLEYTDAYVLQDLSMFVYCGIERLRKEVQDESEI